jgi:hypothetical protein
MSNLRTEKANHAQLNKQLLDLSFDVGDLRRAALVALCDTARQLLRAKGSGAPGSSTGCLH